MISRVAECCFWLHRHAERAESMARLLRVNRSFLLDVNLPEFSRWWPVVIVSGEQERFAEQHPDESARNDGELVQQYLTWDEKCPVSVIGSVAPDTSGSLEPPSPRFLLATVSEHSRCFDSERDRIQRIP